ncbi:hypothetical protein RFI_18074 [Reticulomyxa filosa]|uniref:Uncharacterized protein n=1 Tax=Reticulomyxa filosa TaxID=46433 RepID=X6N1F7_RETFI|nr:hypothetical protein RFI_18074 [Reticulomyxa filosa]|eukprot:ETO19157.1 hypothetical protein RFI_18074 [Reticulomyxa filosa]
MNSDRNINTNYATTYSHIARTRSAHNERSFPERAQQRARYPQNYKYPQSLSPFGQQRKPPTAQYEGPPSQISLPSMCVVGTGEFLESRSLVGNEIEVPREDLDITGPIAKLELSAKKVEPQKVNETIVSDSGKNRQVGNKPQDTVTLTHGKKAYNKDEFFDKLNLDSSKNMNQGQFSLDTTRPGVQISQRQRQLDVETFGSVAEKYRFASSQRNVGQTRSETYFQQLTAMATRRIQRILKIWMSLFHFWGYQNKGGKKCKIVLIRKAHRQ